MSRVMREIAVGKTKFGRKFFVIAGPCVVETEAITMKTAATMQKMCADLRIPFIFKASYDKANRTSARTFRGRGMKFGLQVLSKVKEKLGVLVLTDVHNLHEIAPVAEVVDVLQIPAFLCRQTDLVQAAGRTGKCVNVKKGQFVAPWNMRGIVEKIEMVGNRNILITERGASFGYNNLVADMRSIPIMQEIGYPVVFDATHSVQLPGGGGTFTSGDWKMAPVLARAAVAAGANGIFLETHPNPAKALSDGPNMIPLKQMRGLLKLLKELHDTVAA
jgi:2-dehydro-3-deoxyphosphooctonate aldolase (KDO 8-P synthase)